MSKPAAYLTKTSTSLHTLQVNVKLTLVSAHGVAKPEQLLLNCIQSVFYHSLGYVHAFKSDMYPTSNDVRQYEPAGITCYKK